MRVRPKSLRRGMHVFLKPSHEVLEGRRVARELTAIVERRGKPGTIVSDHGTEFTCNAMLAWSKDTVINWHFIAPGKPMQNGFIESFMYGRPLLCKVYGEGWAAPGSGAFMYAAC
jgi:putative transposase